MKNIKKKNNTEIFSFLEKIISKKGKFPGTTIKDKENYRYLSTGEIDSLEILKIVIKIEKKFKIKFKSKDFETDNFRTIGGLISIIKRNQEK